jgi:phage shock protein A
MEMAELLLISPRQRQLKPLVEAAIHNELRLLEAGIRRTEQRLQQFEARYGLLSAEFIRRYERDELEETLEFAEWIGEYRLLERLQEKADTLREIRFAN